MRRFILVDCRCRTCLHAGRLPLYRRSATDIIHTVWGTFFRSIHGLLDHLDRLLHPDRYSFFLGHPDSVPSGVLVGLINLSNNLRDHDGDKAHGRKTMPVVMGRKNALTFMSVMFAFCYVWVVGLILLGDVTPWILLSFLSIPKALTAIKGFAGKTEAITMVPAMKATAQTNTFFGLLMFIGLLIHYFIQ